MSNIDCFLYLINLIIVYWAVGYSVVFAMENIDVMMASEDATWRDILYSVLADMNPWDIDIVELATRYSGKVDDMAEMNFRVPANVVLVCSVLLRMKAEILTPKVQEYPDISASLDFIFNSDYPISALIGGEIEPYPISIKPARNLTRRVTADELIEAIQDALTEKTKRAERMALTAAKKAGQGVDVHEDIVFESEVNMLELIESTYARIMDILSTREVAVFSDMAKTRDDVLHMFLSILHLSNSQRLSLSQDQLFGEIYIRPC